MAVAVREQEIQRLARFYRTAVQDLAALISTVDFERPRMSSHMQEALLILAILDERTLRWARRNIASLYRSASKEAQNDLKRLGVTVRDKGRTAAFARIDEQAIRALLADPQVGFISVMGDATQQIKEKMRTIQNQARRLVQHERFFNETIARVGVLEGKTVAEIRDNIVREMTSFKNVSELNFTAAARKLPPTEIVRNVVDLPYVQIPAPNTVSGVRNIRADTYADMMARTKAGQAANLARRNKSLQHNQPLIQISPNRPLDNDACSLFIGKAFALTQDAKDEWGVPLVSELPNGGAPFHPNCTHQELLFVPEFRNQSEVDLAIVPPPSWALNRPYGVVQKEYQQRGGFANVDKFNKAGAALGRGTGGRVRRGNVDGDEFEAREPNEPRRRRRRDQ